MQKVARHTDTTWISQKLSWNSFYFSRKTALTNLKPRGNNSETRYLIRYALVSELVFFLGVGWDVVVQLLMGLMYRQCKWSDKWQGKSYALYGTKTCPTTTSSAINHTRTAPESNSSFACRIQKLTARPRLGVLLISFYVRCFISWNALKKVGT